MSYRNIVYNNRDSTCTLFTWDQDGKRIVLTSTFEPYLYVESPKGDKTSIYGTKVIKRAFTNTYYRNKFVQDSGLKRVFESLPAQQQFLLDTYWQENEKPEFNVQPLKTCFLDIETFSPDSFPDVDNPEHTCNVITCHDNFSNKFYTFGLKPYTGEANPAVIYKHCKSEEELFISFVEYLEQDYPDIITGWNCIEENQHVWLDDRIVKIKSLSKDYEGKPLKRHGTSISNYMSTGVKDEYSLETEHGNKVLCSKDHRFMVYKKEKNKYKNHNTLTRDLLELSVEDIERGQGEFDYYAVKHLGSNDNKDLTYRDYVDMFRDYLEPFIVEDSKDYLVCSFTNRKSAKDCITLVKDDIISYDILQLLGFIFTDGTYDIKGDVYRWTSKDRVLTEAYTEVYNNENSTNLKLSTKCDTRFKDKKFTSYSKQIGRNNNIGVLHRVIYNNGDKKQPCIELLSRLSHNQFKAFFSGMVDGDGCISKPGGTGAIDICNYDCVKYNFLHDLQELLLWNGVQSTIHSSNVNLRIPCHCINSDFMKSLNLFHPRRRERLDLMTAYAIKNTPSKNIRFSWGGGDEYLVRIKPIRRTGRSVNMCDITTATHTFLCNGIHTHNCEGFDIPYIINRMERILGQEYVDRLSPLGRVHFRMMRGSFGQEKKRYYIDGIACPDYLDVYKRFCFKLRESYKLDAIGEIELGKKKVDFGDMSLAELSEKDWNLFVDYNIQDVNLLVKLEEKLQYLSLLRKLSYVGLTTLEGAMGTIQVINGALCIRARNRGEVLSTFVRNVTEGKNPGAYVAEPKGGFKNHIVSFDANSLYPNVMISLNTSPETKVGRVETLNDNVIINHVSGKQFSLDKPAFVKFLKDEECALSKAGFLFSQKRKGIIPEFLDYYYNKRVEVKKRLFKVKQQHKKDPTNTELKYEMERLNTEQMVIKILVNSCYGYMGNKRAPIGDDDIAASVTLTGQAVIKQSNEFIKEFLKSQLPDISDYNLEQCIVYNDTDSGYISIAPLVSEGIIKFWDGKDIHKEAYDMIQQIEDYLNLHINEWAKKSLLTKDSRFLFKRECIADVGVFLQKKRYVMHILDDEGIKEDKFKYTGVEVVRTTMPNAIKPYAKKIIETMLTSQSLRDTNKILYESYDIFKSLPPEDMSFVMGIKNYEKYAPQCNGFNTCKGMPIHVKSAYYYNMMLDKLGLDNKHEKISSGDKVRYMYVEQPNKYGLETIAFKYDYPPELAAIFKPDYEKMFEKILFESIKRFYDNVNWIIRRPAENVQTELFDLFS